MSGGAPPRAWLRAMSGSWGETARWIPPPARCSCPGRTQCRAEAGSRSGRWPPRDRAGAYVRALWVCPDSTTGSVYGPGMAAPRNRTSSSAARPCIASAGAAAVPANLLKVTWPLGGGSRQLAPGQRSWSGCPGKQPLGTDAPGRLVGHGLRLSERPALRLGLAGPTKIGSRDRPRSVRMGSGLGPTSAVMGIRCGVAGREIDAGDLVWVQDSGSAAGIRVRRSGVWVTRFRPAGGCRCRLRA